MSQHTFLIQLGFFDFFDSVNVNGVLTDSSVSKLHVWDLNDLNDFQISGRQ